MGRWFGVTGDGEMETTGWPRTGTLPRNEAVRSYAILPQEEPERTGVEMDNRRSESETEQPTAANRPQPGERGRGSRGLERLAATLTLRRRQRVTSRDDVQKTLPKFWPVATVLVAVAELALLTAILVQEGFAPIAFKPRIVNDVIEGFGNSTEFVTREDVPNFFIGPSGSNLIHIGAKYTPVSCVRKRPYYLQYNSACSVDIALECLLPFSLSVCVRTSSSRWRQLSGGWRRTVSSAVLDLLSATHSVACYHGECEKLTHTMYNDKGHTCIEDTF